MKFTDKLHQAVSQQNTVLCIGLDPEPARIPEFIRRRHSTVASAVTDFCSMVIEATKDLCVAYKPNLAFFESLGSDGLRSFEHILHRIPESSVTIADAKRGDIGNTASKYAEAFFKHWKCDSITLSPLMGFETIDPFTTDRSKGVFVLTLTSNPGASDFMLKPFAGYELMAEFIAYELEKRDSISEGHIGMVVGATRPELLKKVIRHHPSATLLIPGVGAQGGNVDELGLALESHNGVPLINVGRAILYASDTRTDEEFKHMITGKTLDYVDALSAVTGTIRTNLSI
jgi:orotidine-5'-phosphate decarboxylase